MNRFTLLIILILTTFCVSAQNTVTGLVTDSQGEPLIGATVLVKGTKTASVTDLDGKFSIKAKEGQQLQVTYVGFRPENIKVGTADTLRIVMQEEANTLDEMIVVGYGTMKKADLTGAVSNVDGAKLEGIRATSVSQSLQGAMPGLEVSRSSGMPGATATLRVRGVTTIGDSSPLVIVDGIPDSIESVNSSDIENITVLKDAASASIYGARAAAGVILITTKKAKEGKAKIEYQGTVGFVQSTESPKAVGAIDYMNLYNELKWNDGGNQEGQEYSIYSKDFIDSYAQNHLSNPDEYPMTDWYDLLMRKTAPTTKHDLKVSYGNKVVQTKISLGYEYTEALYKGRDYQRLNARVNNNFIVTKWLSFGLDAYYRHGITKTPPLNPMAATLYMTPLDPAVNSNGTYAAGNNGTNPLAALEGGVNRKWTDRMGAKISMILNPVEGLTITGIWAPGKEFTTKKNYSKKIPYYTFDNPDEPAGYAKGYAINSLTQDRDQDLWSTKQLFVNYTKTFAENHKTDFMLGYEDYSFTTSTMNAASNNMELSDYFFLANANSNDLSVGGTETDNAYRSIFGRINYAFKGRYLLQVNARWDRSSRFDKRYRTGFFPSASVGWTMSEEKFMRDIDPRSLSYLKIRGSYGTLGNERIGNYYPYQATMTFAHPVMVDAAGNLTSVLTASQRDYNIPDITWETTHTWDIGLDATFLNSRLSLTFDWYWKRTKDMLLSIQLPCFMGYDNPKQNAGEMTTKGWDLQLGWRDAVGDFNYSVNFNISDYRSVMGKMKGTVLDSGGHITREGDEYNAWYGYVSDGIFQNLEELANYPTLNANTNVGDIRYKDLGGSEGLPDGAINAQYDRRVLGSSLPRLLYGAQISAGWKGVELSAAFNGIGKQNVMMSRAMMYQRHAAGWTQFTGEVIGTSWSYYNTPEQNLAAKYPRLSDTAVDGGTNSQTSDFWMFNGGYFRCKNITLGYSFQKNILKKLRVENLRVFASVSDPFSINNYPQGWDPESNSDGSSYIARTWNFGVSVRF